MSREHSGTNGTGQTGEIRPLLRSIRYAVGNILLTGLVFVVFGVLLTESMSIVLTRTLPTGYVHIAAAAVGLLLGYAAAVTVALREVVRGVIGSIERIVTEVEHVGAQLAHTVESLSNGSGDHHSETSHPPRTDGRGSIPSYYDSGDTSVANMMIRPVERIAEVAGAGQRE